MWEYFRFVLFGFWWKKSQSKSDTIVISNYNLLSYVHTYIYKAIIWLDSKLLSLNVCLFAWLTVRHSMYLLFNFDNVPVTLVLILVLVRFLIGLTTMCKHIQIIIQHPLDCLPSLSVCLSVWLIVALSVQLNLHKICYRTYFHYFMV